MRRETKSIVNLTVLSATLIAFCLGASITAQTTQTQNSSAPAENLQINQMGDLGQLNLTQDQVDKIRDIWDELKIERQTAGLKLRKAQSALNDAIESPNPDETLIAQRSREVAEAQAHTIRLRSLTEARVLQVLTPGQRMRIREIRIRNQALQAAARQRQRANAMGQRQGLQGGAKNPTLTPAQRRAIRRLPKP